MFEIDIDIIDEFRKTHKSYLRLNPNVILIPYITYPISWEGFLNGEKISLTQLDASCHIEDDFKFVMFPVKYSYLKREIIKAIHKKMRTLN